MIKDFIIFYIQYFIKSSDTLLILIRPVTPADNTSNKIEVLNDVLSQHML